MIKHCRFAVNISYHAPVKPCSFLRRRESFKLKMHCPPYFNTLWSQCFKKNLKSLMNLDPSTCQIYIKLSSLYKRWPAIHSAIKNNNNVWTNYHGSYIRNILPVRVHMPRYSDMISCIVSKGVSLSHRICVQFCCACFIIPVDTRRNNNAIMISNNDMAMSFWRYNNVIITPCVR